MQSALDKLRELSVYLEQLESELAIFFNLSLDGFMIADNAGVIIKVNNAWLTLIGYEKNEMIGKNYLDFVIDEDKDKTNRARLTLPRNVIFNFKNTYKHKDGSHCKLSWTARATENITYAVARKEIPND